MLPFDACDIAVDKIRPSWLPEGIRLSVLRLDRIDPLISGNKWFKLKYFLQDAQQQKRQGVATFGGAYSNHIAATAAACAQLGIAAHGFIRGERPLHVSHTLALAEKMGMQLHFLSREAYRNKAVVEKSFPQYYWIAEGGYGKLGAKGAAEIVQRVPDFAQYTHWVTAVGTGTTIAGLLMAVNKNQKVIGVSVMKGNASLENEILSLVSDAENKKWQLQVWQQYHWGGYAKKQEGLLDFMNDFFRETHIPLDFVYTAKAMWAVKSAIEKELFAPDSNILVVHTGGLQGNLSLPPERLNF